jgi:hypothetical protein
MIERREAKVSAAYAADHARGAGEGNSLLQMLIGGLVLVVAREWPFGELTGFLR